MTKRLFHLILISGAFLATSASVALANNTGQVTIERIAPWGSNTQVKISKTVCGGTSQIQFSTSSSVHERNFDIAMAALLAGKKVDINYSCSGSTANGASIRIFP